MAKREEFWRKVAGVYDDRIDSLLGNDLRPMVLEELGTEGPLGRSVEFGCGTGYFTPLLARLSDEVTATDLVEPMLEIARERVGGLSNVTVQVANCEETSFPPDSFDTVFLGLTLQLADGPQTVAEMARILRQGGRLIVVVPTMEGLSMTEKIKCIARNYRAYGTMRPPGTKLYSRRTLPPLIERGGFRIIETTTLADPVHPGGFTGLYVRAERL